MAAPTGRGGLEDLLRELAPQVLGVLVRRYGDFDRCEDAVQEALLAAAVQWPEVGRPEHPRSWLITVARRRLADEWRRDSSRVRREERAYVADLPLRPELDEPAEAGTAADEPGVDDTLTLLFLCCHPALTATSQLALTLRAVGGLSTAEIARALLVPESTMAQRISRAKERIRATGQRFDLPPTEDRVERLAVVLHVLYLIFNEGYAASTGAQAQRSDLTAEAIRLTRLLHTVSDAAEVAGLLALMLLTDARRAARVEPDGTLVPLAEQDRTRWDGALIAEGIALISRTLGTAGAGPYQLQAAIAAVHDEAPSDAETDWPQILALYGVLDTVAPSPVVTLNRAVALARVHGPRAGLALLGTLDADERMGRSHRLPAVRGHLLELTGDLEGARACYRRAARMTASVPERNYLTLRAARL